MIMSSFSENTFYVLKIIPYFLLSISCVCDENAVGVERSRSERLGKSCEILET
jgi:hypothetical protein